MAVGRAGRSWRAGAVLEAAGVPVPRRVFLARVGPRTRVLALERLAGARPLVDLVRAGAAGPGLFHRVGEAVGRMHAAGVIHGDLKWVNVLAVPGGEESAPGRVWLLDLDAARRPRLRRGLFRGAVRDVARFLRAAAEAGASGTETAAFSEGYRWSAPFEGSEAVVAAGAQEAERWAARRAGS
nr:lipopolysaccharide kinase InaA family protein [Dissulfurirhabdus thermomarina]